MHDRRRAAHGGDEHPIGWVVEGRSCGLLSQEPSRACLHGEVQQATPTAEVTAAEQAAESAVETGESAEEGGTTGGIFTR